MKRIISLLSLLVLCSCNSLFQEEDNEYIVLDKQQAKIDIVNGLYSRLVNVHNVDYFKTMIRADDINLYYSYDLIYGDTIINGNFGYYGGGGNNRPDINFSQVTGHIYKNLYNLIITANSLLPKLTGDGDKALKGEIYFLRAYSNFKLARLFGTPPLVTDPDVKFTLQKPMYKDFYEFIEKDLLMAIELLPDTYTKVRIPGETAHKGTAKALLAEVYLAWAGFPVNDQSKYAKAALLSGEVIEQAGYYNFALLPDISDLWTIQNRHNQESIFGLFFNPVKEIREIKDFKRNSLLDTENTINYNNAPYQDFSPIGSYHPEIQFYNDFPNNYRKKCFYPAGNDPKRHTHEFITCTFSIKWIDRDTYKKKTYQAFCEGSQVTLYLLRYAQTLLTYAEARARSGKLDESAFEAVNMVRRRANRLDIHTPSKFDLSKDLTTDQFLDAVVWERAWELSFEPEGRWFDIIRLDLKDKVPESNFPRDAIYLVPPEFLTKDWYFYKIPVEDLLINPNFE